MASGNAPISRFRRHDGVTDVTDVLFPLLPLRVRKFWHFGGQLITISYLFLPHPLETTGAAGKALAPLRRGRRQRWPEGAAALVACAGCLRLRDAAGGGGAAGRRCGESSHQLARRETTHRARRCRWRLPRFWPAPGRAGHAGREPPLQVSSTLWNAPCKKPSRRRCPKIARPRPAAGEEGESSQRAAGGRNFQPLLPK